jgi:hypothetical protein
MTSGMREVGSRTGAWREVMVSREVGLSGGEASKHISGDRTRASDMAATTATHPDD